ncbi:MAG TPA: GAF domain-containing sensor histidine kinase [Candidatus Saccharimonadales bacterium]|nr:GAF domain-containing sensor histidine kinase [Candidatus Saccharimonadales bacterium]
MPFFKNIFGFKKSSDNDNNTLLSSEVKHINEELYKKGAELAERNKTLSLLQRINEVILSSIIHPEQIARLVTSLLVTNIDFQVVSIYLYEKENEKLQRLACSQIGKNGEMISDSQLPAYYYSEIPATDINNMIVQSITSKKMQTNTTLVNVIYSNTGNDPELQNPENIKSVFIYPFLVRNEVIGALVVGLKDTEQNLSEYRRDLLNRLAEVIGIGMDNAMLYNKVQATNQKLIELDKLKNEFVSVASHELRTPMTAIRSYLWMALNDKGGPLTEKQRYYVERGYNSADRLIRLVNDMLNISRIESGRISIELKSVDLIKLTQDVVEEVLPRANELGVSVVVQKPEALPLVLADSDKIKEVFFNLIGNSLKFTPKGGTITISYSQVGGFIETKITDTGAGIEPQDISKLFQKFGLLPGSYITNQTVAIGTGLGLYICRSIINLHHGQIHAASPGRGKGATFIFTLKIFEDSDLQNIKKEGNDDKEKVELIHMSV